MDIQEIIDLLEKAIAEYDGPRIKFYYANANVKYYVAEQKLFDQALTLLKQQPTEPTSLGNTIRHIADNIKSEIDRNIICQAADRLDAWWKYINELKEEVELLKQPTKQYLPSELIKDNNFVCQNCHHIHEMGGYKVVKQQPKAGEWTKEVRPFINKNLEVKTSWLMRKLYKACDIIDTAEAIKTDLLDACVGMVKDLEMIEQDEAITACQCMAKTPDDITEPLPCYYCAAKTAIAKAKRDRE